ncbi:MAG: response regulator transcription factor [Firmicutes bacterium]|nr:response regulator transcription factor [Bacillota bacterium]
MTLRVLIADDHPLMRRGVARVLELERDISLAGEASSGREAVEKALVLKPDVVIMDVSMPDMSGVAAASSIKRDCPGVGVVILTIHDDEQYVYEAARAGVSAYIMKDVDPAELVKAVRAAAEGRTYVHPAIIPKLLKGCARPTAAEAGQLRSLTRRETEVLDLVSQGLSNKQIAERLFISEKTVKNHLSSIFGKIGVDDRTQAALFGLRHGLGGQAAP